MGQFYVQINRLSSQFCFDSPYSLLNAATCSALPWRIRRCQGTANQNGNHRSFQAWWSHRRPTDIHDGQAKYLAMKTAYRSKMANVNAFNRLTSYIVGRWTIEKTLEERSWTLYHSQLQKRNAPVAQLDRVLGYEPRGRAFESLRARQ